MIRLDRSKRKFFNTEKGQIVNYPKEITERFIDGYTIIEKSSIDSENVKYIVYDIEGNEREIEDENIMNLAWYTNSNGKIFSVNKDENKFYIIDLKTFDIIENNYKFKKILNKPEFSDAGYAVIAFEDMNEEYYYVVIDSNGVYQFKPCKIDMQTNEVKNIQNINMQGKYFVITYEGEQVIYNVYNEIVLKTEKFESVSEIFEGMVKINYDNNLYRSMYEDLYYLKDFSGNIIKYNIK